MVKGDRQAWKAAYFEKASKLLTQYEKVKQSLLYSLKQIFKLNSNGNSAEKAIFRVGFDVLHHSAEFQTDPQAI